MAYALDIDKERAEQLLVTLADWDAVSQDAKDRDCFIAKAEPEAAPNASALLDEVRKHTYRGLPTWKRVAVLSAGVGVNLVAALLVFLFMLTVVGTPTQSLKLAAVVPGGPAATAGVMAGDTITAIDGVKTPEWQDVLDTLAKMQPGKTVTLTVLRNGVDKTLTVVLGKNSAGKAKLGIEASMVNVRISLPEALKESFTWIGLVFKAIGGFFNPHTFKTTVSESSSIVGASVEVSRAAAAGPLYFTWIVALLSLSLGVINVVPIPPLDGGKIALEIIERIVGKPLPRNFTLGISVVGTMMLFALIGYLMYSDIVRYVVNHG